MGFTFINRIPTRFAVVGDMGAGIKLLEMFHYTLLCMFHGVFMGCFDLRRS